MTADHSHKHKPHDAHEHGAHEHPPHKRTQDKEHGHGHHGHAHAENADENRLLIALAITASFMLAEIIGGVLSGSLALIADAGHMATDSAALALAWLSTRQARKPATALRSYGHLRAQVLAAFINGAALIGLSIWIVVEAIHRFISPVGVLGGPMLIVAALGLVVNIIAFFVLQGGSKDNINMRGALLHVMGDLLGSAAAIVAAVVIIFTGWMPIDPLLSIFVSLLIVRGAWSLVTSSWHVLMEGAPAGFDLGEMIDKLKAAAPGVLDVHHVHIWGLTPDKPIITLHARVEEGVNHTDALKRLHRALDEQFGLTHATIQLEYGPCPEGDAHGH